MHTRVAQFARLPANARLVPVWDSADSAVSPAAVGRTHRQQSRAGMNPDSGSGGAHGGRTFRDVIRPHPGKSGPSSCPSGGRPDAARAGRVGAAATAIGVAAATTH